MGVSGIRSVFPGTDWMPFAGAEFAPERVGIDDPHIGDAVLHQLGGFGPHVQNAVVVGEDFDPEERRLVGIAPSLFEYRQRIQADIGDRISFFPHLHAQFSIDMSLPLLAPGMTVRSKSGL